jgi:hypothetical protein
MPISISIIIVSLQLIVAVADAVPKFDIARSCKLDLAATAGLTVDQSIKSCMSDERRARQQPDASGQNCLHQAGQVAPRKRALVARQAM